MLKKLYILIVSTIVALMLSSPVVAEKTVQDFQTWGMVLGTGNFSSFNPNNPNLEKFKWWMEGQGRFGDDSSRFSQAIIRPGVGYAVSDTTSLWVGYAWIPTDKPFAAGDRFNENRIWQQLLWAKPYSFGKITSRTRTEQRFFDIPGSSDVAYRFRQFFKWSIPMPAISPKAFFILQDEVFVNLNDTDVGIRAGFNQNRFFTGFGYNFNKTVTGEIGYLNQYLNRPENPRPDQMQHILGVNLFLNFN